MGSVLPQWPSTARDRRPVGKTTGWERYCTTRKSEEAGEGELMLSKVTLRGGGVCHSPAGPTSDGQL